MPPRKNLYLVALFVLGSAVLPVALAAQNSSGRTVPFQVLVTVGSKTKDAPPEVPKDAVYVHQDNQTRRVLDWQPLSQGGATLDLVVYIDDSMDHSVGVPLMDAAAFIRTLPPNARIEIAYSLSGHPQIGRSFTTDREAAIKALHIPLGRSTGSYGLYSGLTEFVHGWPQDATRRELLIISDGIDLLRGSSQSVPGENPDLAILNNVLRREGIVVFTIFGSGGSALLHGSVMTSVGQSCLQSLSNESGGEAFLGLQTAYSFTPYLDRISQDLAHQYLLTFEAVAPTNNKPKLSKLQVGAEVPGTVIHAPAHVNVPPSPAAQ